MKVKYVLGAVFSTKRYGDIKIVEELPDRKSRICFINTGFIKICSNSDINKGTVCDNSVGMRVYGWGINDADYVTQTYHTINGKRKKLWTCPIYEDWVAIIERCHSEKYKEKYPSYNNCAVCEEWQYFSNFRRWVLEEQPNKDWENCVPDKDFLSGDVKIYSPTTVVYIHHSLNNFILARENGRGNHLIGCTFYKRNGKFLAKCSNPFTKKEKFLGYYLTEFEAHLAWKAKKNEYACQLADLQEDARIADALRSMYAME